MAWRCVLYESFSAACAAGNGTWPHVGAMWQLARHLDYQGTGAVDECIAPNYLRDWKGKRPPLAVMTPGGPWVIDGKAYNKEQGYHGEGWKVTGEPPLLTARPSINIVNHYHGWLTDGVLTDDCDGRAFHQHPATA